MSPLFEWIAHSSLSGASGKPQAWPRLCPKSIPFSRRAYASVYETPSRAAIPERLLIHHAGTGKIVFLGILKVTTIFLFSTTLFFVAPKYYFDKEQPTWVAPAVAAAGAVPLIYMTYYSSPFVAYVHIRLPVFARRSREQLLKWSQNIAPNTEIEMTTLKSYGSLRTSRMQISELQPTRALFGIQNLLREPRLPSSWQRPWWAPKEQRLFFVGNERRKTVETAVWQKVLSQIQNNGKRPANVVHQ